MRDDKPKTASDILEKLSNVGHEIQEAADKISDTIKEIDELFSETSREGFDKLIAAGLVPGATFTSTMVSGDLVVVSYSVAYPCNAIAVLRCMGGDTDGKEHHVHIDMFAKLSESGKLTRKG